MSQHTLAADIGGTNIRVAVINQDGVIIEEKRITASLSQNHFSSRSEAEAHILSTLKKALKPTIQAHHIEAVGMGFPGFFHTESALLASSPNLPLLQDFALAARLSKQLSLPVTVENDALCAAIGEHRFGAGQGHSNLLHITLGTGIGSGLILNNHPYSGEHGMAMEFGHLCIEHHEGRRCGCGNRGCVEAYASATAISQRYAEQTNHPQHNSQVIFQKAEGGDQQAKKVIIEAGIYLGMAIADAVKLLDVSTVTISGGLSGAWSMLHPALMHALNNNLIPPQKHRVTVLRTTLDDRAGLLGAAVIARKRDQTRK